MVLKPSIIAQTLTQSSGMRPKIQESGRFRSDSYRAQHVLTPIYVRCCHKTGIVVHQVPFVLAEDMSQRMLTQMTQLTIIPGCDS